MIAKSASNQIRNHRREKTSLWTPVFQYASYLNVNCLYFCHPKVMEFEIEDDSLEAFENQVPKNMFGIVIKRNDKFASLDRLPYHAMHKLELIQQNILSAPNASLAKNTCT